SQLTHQLADHGQTSVGMDEVHLLECAEWVVNIAPEEVRHLRGEAPSHLRAKRIGDAGDEDAAGLVREHQPPNLIEWSLCPNSFRASPDRTVTPPDYLHVKGGLRGGS